MHITGGERDRSEVVPLTSSAPLDGLQDAIVNFGYVGTIGPGEEVTTEHLDIAKEVYEENRIRFGI